jgi:hypothetical protein
MAETEDDRTRALQDLLLLRRPLAESLAALRAYPWDSDVEYVELTPAHVASVLERFLGGEVDAPTATEWAESINLRDDVGRSPGTDAELADVLTEMSSPELFGELDEIAPDLLRRLR